MGNKKSANPSDIAHDIRTKKLEAMKERDRFLDRDELEQLRDENQAVRTYCAKLEQILANAEGQLVRMGTKPATPAKSELSPFKMPKANGGAPKRTRPSANAPKQTTLPGELGKVVPQ
jgi:uncharacterized protein (DUF3084 family)